MSAAATQPIHGILTPHMVPLDVHGEINESELRRYVDWLIEQGIADPARVAIWGWSYGGYQTLYNLTHSKKLGVR